MLYRILEAVYKEEVRTQYFYGKYRRFRRMAFRNFFLVSVIGVMLLMWLNVSDTVILHYYETHHKEDRSLGDGTKGHIVCHCNGRKTTQLLSDAGIDAVFRSIQNQNFCGFNDQSRICKLLKECNDCTAEVERCKPIPEGGFDCLKKIIEMRDKYFINFNKNNGSRAVLTRKLRQASNSCVYPKDLKTADLYVGLYPNYIRVTEQCIFGHTLKEGITREVRCLYAKNKWEPTGFEECRPFVDCTLRLNSPGYVSCAKATRDPPHCNVSCDHYEDKSAVPEMSYECQIDGDWSPALPYCVTTGSGLVLAPAPRVKLLTTNQE